MSKHIDNIIIDGARIIYRNFAGVESRYNRRGDRNFCVVIDDESLVRELKKDGWNIKEITPMREGEKTTYYLQVKVNFNNKPPKIYLITDKAKVPLDEESVSSLDYADIVHVDVNISPFPYEMGGKSGISAYLQSMCVIQKSDPVADRYPNGYTPHDVLPFGNE